VIEEMSRPIRTRRSDGARSLKLPVQRHAVTSGFGALGGEKARVALAKMLVRPAAHALHGRAD
jgi:hypothetical protein